MTNPEFSPTKAMVAWMQAIAPYGIFTTDKSLRIRSWNDWLTTQSNFAEEDVIGRRLVDVYPEVEERHFDKHYARALAGEIVVLSTALHKYLLPFPAVIAEGVTSHMLQTVRIAPLSEEGEIVGTITVVEDVTQREMQASILQRQQELERLLSAALALLLQSRDPSAEVAAIFNSIAPVLGLDSYLCYLLDGSAEQLLLNSVSGLSPKQREALATLPLTEPDRRTLRSTVGPTELDIARHATTLRRLGVRAAGSFPLIAGDRLLGLIVFATYQADAISASDLSILSRIARYLALALDRALRERETVAASRAKDDFLAALSHELRTPLNPVLLLASESEGNAEFPAEAREAFRVIEKNVLLEARLIDDLLDLTRIEHGKLALEMEVVDLHAILRDAIETVRADVVRQHMSLDLNLPGKECHVLGDSARLQQIFWNVIKNAVKFTPAGGRIGITTTSNAIAQEVMVKITDTGIGMDPKELGSVFGAFAQGDHSRPGGPHRFGGLGLGLAISKKLVESHRGRIEASSGGKNQRSAFIIYLPQAAPGLKKDETSPKTETKPAPPRTAGPPAQIRGKILLVEDHEPSRTTLTYLLKRRGFEVTAVASSATALKVAAAAKFDLVISDIGLPDMDGVALMRRLKREYGSVGIALTGYGMEEDITRTREAGFLAHLTKPISVDALDRALAKTFPPGGGV